MQRSLRAFQSLASYLIAEDSAYKDNKLTRKGMVETSDDRNGIAVNRTRSTHEGTSDRLNKRHSELSDRGEVQQKGENCSAKMHAKSEYEYEASKQCFTALVR